MDLSKNQSVFLVITGAYLLNGGIAKVNQLVIESLLKKNYQIDIAALNEGDDDKNRYYKFVNNFRSFKNNKYKFALYVWSEVFRKKYTIIMVDHINLGIILAPFQILGLREYYVWLFGTEIMPPRPDFEGYIGLKFASRRIAISDFTSKILLAKYPTLNVDVCPLSINEEESIIANKELQVFSTTHKYTSVNGMDFHLGSKLILNVARMVKPSSDGRDKGQTALIKAFPIILKRVIDAQLMFVGDGEDLDYFLSLVKDLPLDIQSKICFAGKITRNELWFLFSRCNMFAMPSSGEGFGLVYLEAMAFEKPCVGLKKDATPDIIKDNINGLLVDCPVDVTQLADKIFYLLSNPVEAKRMGEAGREMLVNNYLFSHFSERFLNLLQR